MNENNTQATNVQNQQAEVANMDPYDFMTMLMEARIIQPG